MLALAMGSVQVEHAGPTDSEDRDREQLAAAARIGALAGREHERIAALAEVSQRSSAADDFGRGLDMLLGGIGRRADGQARDGMSSWGGPP